MNKHNLDNNVVEVLAQQIAVNIKQVLREQGEEGEEGEEEEGEEEGEEE